MPSILSHPAVPVALGLALGRNYISPRLLGVGIFCSILPDLDVIAFRLDIAYTHELGHRGASHSLSFAFLLGMLALFSAQRLQSSRTSAFMFVTISSASHGLLDMLTNGGKGVALFWPFSSERWFFSWQPIQVSPLSLNRFFSEAGIAVLYSEILWIWLPAVLVYFSIDWLRRR